MINLSDGLRLHIVVTSPGVASQPYIDKINTFHLGTLGPDGLVRCLDIRSRPQTQPGTGVYTPGVGPITVKHEVGSGAFGVASRVWEVSTGYAYAVKEPHQTDIRDGTVDVGDWMREAHLHSQVSHVSCSLAP